MKTYFAPAERAGQEKLAAEIEIMTHNEVITGLLHSVGGLLAVLNEHRQIAALNDSFLELLGLDDPQQALGLRPGEALECIHAQDGPGGCGTSKFCSTCGAAAAIVAGLDQGIPSERICALSADRNGKITDFVFLVKAQPIEVDKKRFLLLFFQDVTRQEQRAALERTFYHDVNNMLCMLLQASELLMEDYPSKLTASVHRTALRLSKEVDIQKCLSENQSVNYRPVLKEITAEQIVKELRVFFDNHPAAKRKNIEYSENCPPITVNSDFSLLLRVLGNMVLNALEATEENGSVKVWLEYKGDLLRFRVWNSQEIPANVAERIFQRNFSTKNQAGRGFGTYSMKLFGEQILGGQVDFTSSKEKGTVFTFACPV